MKSASFDAVSDSEEGNQWQTVKNLLSYLWPAGRFDLKARIVFSMLFLALAKATNILVPLLIKEAVDFLGQKKNDLELPYQLVIGYGLAFLMVVVFGELRDLLFLRVRTRAQRSIALTTFEHLHRLSLRFHLERQTGGLSRVIERGLRGMEFVLSFMLFNILPTILEVVLVSAVLFWSFKPDFAILTLVTIGGYIAFTLLVTEWRLKFRKTMNESDSDANNKAIDSLINFETVKYFGNEEHEKQRYDVSLERYEAASIKSQKSLSLLNIGQGSIIAVGLTWILVLAAKGVISGEMTVGEFVMVQAYLLQLQRPLNFLGFVYREVKRSLVDMQKMFELLGVNREIEDVEGASELQIKGGEIEFKDVHFSYDGDRAILSGVDFKLGAGMKVAVVGSSGAGKSTLSRLLFRFYDVTSGEILIDGQDIREIQQKTLRDQIGMVPQDTVLFNDTIKYNIDYGRPGSSTSDVEDALRMASLDKFVETLPEGLETRVGERGLKLSGGEKQRVAIARTILKDPPILILDEATSALDTKTEQQIQESLEEVSKNRTTLVIAHRLSTIVDSDLIVVLDGGKVVEQGRHDDLLERRGHYAELWQRQQDSADAAAT